MNNGILIELAKRWENDALYEDQVRVTEALRMCADGLRMLVDFDQHAEAVKAENESLKNELSAIRAAGSGAAGGAAGGGGGDADYPPICGGGGAGRGYIPRGGSGPRGGR